MFSANSAAKSGLVSAALVFADSSVMEEPVRIKERKICRAVSWFANANATSISTLPGLVIAGSSSLRWLVKPESEQKSKEDAKGEVKKDAAEDKPTDKPVPTPSPPAQKLYDSDGDSSDSPIEDWDELYSDDDMVRKLRLTSADPPKRHDERYESEEEGLPDP
ncbi:calpain family cysteine protease [Colletotrichum abscissum]|uniref:Calpain family cysteine protease n=1 Tax=Colletotrichum limetticola TaxID=1209924 RepID=A0ABQ9PLF4_9PEZI|nr:calpain family cysteine protease [Colletotrichum abscissum]KAK0372162.1 calpain family cysteine protease [Colletotrichum limetticola]KAK1520016.1 calpain family cysteine protease [Colletotrichum abscissum]